MPSTSSFAWHSQLLKTVRYLGLHHLAFFRGYLQGLPIGPLADRYLETGLDLRRAKTTVRWIQDALLAVARRTQQSEIVRLLQLAPYTNPTFKTDTLPSLATFAETNHLEGFSESELAQLYQEKYGGTDDRRAQRGFRLQEKQLDALRKLEGWMAAVPALDHRIEGWFDPSIAQKLTASGLLSLGDLINFMNRQGARWWTRIPKIGLKTAERVQRWLCEFGGELSGQLQTHALVPRRSLSIHSLMNERLRSTGLVPLEYFALPTELEGSAGRNRGPHERNKTGARNDYEAIQAWLRTCENNPNTWRSYRTQAERFLLWAILKKRKALSDLNVVDCIDYREFLAHLEAEKEWRAPRRTERWSAQWRPFDQALSPASQKLALTVLKAMCEWLKRQKYLDTNPFDGIPSRPFAGEGTLQISRSFNHAQWHYLSAFAHTLPEDAPSTIRIRFVLLFAYGTGLRLSEMASATTSALQCLDLSAQVRHAWMLKVIGKRQRKREVPMPAPLMSALALYLSSRGLPEDPRLCPPDTPLIGRLGLNQRALAPIGLARVFSAFFERAARSPYSENAAHAKYIREASAHWLRHTHASHAVAAGTALDVIKDNLGHMSLNTTTLYVTAEAARRYKQIEHFLAGSKHVTH